MNSKWLKPSTYPALVVFLTTGIFGGLFALSSYNLAKLFMANFSYLSHFGWLGFKEGGFMQLLGLAANGYVSLLCFLGFKICEEDLIHRFYKK